MSDRHDYMLRVNGEQWERIVKAAAAADESVADWIRGACEMRLSDGGSPGRADVSAALAQLSDVAAKLAAGHVLMPGSEVPGSSWSQMLGHGGSS